MKEGQGIQEVDLMEEEREKVQDHHIIQEIERRVIGELFTTTEGKQDHIQVQEEEKEDPVPLIHMTQGGRKEEGECL